MVKRLVINHRHANTVVYTFNKRLVMTIMFKDVEAVSKKARQDDDLGTEHLQVTRVYGPS